MAKLTGFFMSALLVALCLWINVAHYPNVLRLNDANAQTSSVRSGADSNSPKESVETSNDASVSAKNSGVAENSANDASNSVETPVKNTEEIENFDENNDKESGENNDDSNFVNVQRETNGSNAVQEVVVSQPSDGDAANSYPANFEPASMTRNISDGETSPLPDATKIDRTPSQGVPAQTTPPNSTPTDGAPHPSSNAAAAPNSSALNGSSSIKSTASKPQGGKYVSIPSAETDAFGRSAEFGCRVVGASSAERLSAILSIDETGYSEYKE